MNEIPCGWRVLTIMAYMGEALPERGTLFSGFKYMKDYKGNLSFLPRFNRANRCI